MVRSLRTAAAMALLAVAPLGTGCALLAGAAGAPADDDAHLVTLTEPACSFVVVKTQGDGFGILAPAGPTVLQRGDLLVGALRTGTTALRLLPFPEQTPLAPEPFDVRAAALSLSEAQTRWREVCGVGRDA